MLQQLTLEQASNCPFPVGSSVWYEAEQDDQRLAAGTVQSVSLDFESRRFHYEVNGDAIDEQRIRCFGDGCPIFIRVDEREVAGMVLYGGKKQDEKASYTVKLFECDNRFSTEEGVSADRIRFRAIDTQPCEPGIPETVSLKTSDVSAGEALASKDLPLHETLQEEKGEAPLTPNGKLQRELGRRAKQRQERRGSSTAQPSVEADDDDAPLSPRDKLRMELERRSKQRQERKGPSAVNPSSNEADDEATAKADSKLLTNIRVSSDGSELESILTDDRSILSLSTRENNSSTMLAGNKRGRSEKGSRGNPKPNKAGKIRLAIPGWLTTQDGARQQRLLQHLTKTFQGLPVEIKGHGDEMYLTSTATDLVLINETLQKSLVRFIGTDCSMQNGAGDGNASASHQTESIALQQKAIQARCIARNVALGHLRTEELLSSMDELLVEIQTASPGPLKQAAVQFRAKILWWVDKPGRRHPTLAACDSLRDFLRAQGVDVR